MTAPATIADVVEPMSDEEVAAYWSGEHSWGSSASEDMRRRLVATIFARNTERNRVIAALDEMRAINALLCHWYDEGMELLQKAGIPDDEESPLADLADNMLSHLLSSDGYDFKKVRIFKRMEDRVAQLEEALRMWLANYELPGGTDSHEGIYGRVDAAAAARAALAGGAP